MTARQLIGSTKDNQLGEEEAAADYRLPVEAGREASPPSRRIAYSSNRGGHGPADAPMKLLVVASVLDISLPFGCTPAWWQLLKALHENGVDVIATPYYGRAVASLWWRAIDNPCYRLGATFSRLRDWGRRLPLPPATTAQNRSCETFSERMQRRLAHALVKPRSCS
jgi:hypothetical protein